MTCCHVLQPNRSRPLLCFQSSCAHHWCFHLAIESCLCSVFARGIISMISLFPMAQVCPGGCDPPACSGRAAHRMPSRCSKTTSWWPTQEPGETHSFRSFWSGCVLHPQPHPQPPQLVHKASYSQRELQPSPHTPGRGWEKRLLEVSGLGLVFKPS